MDYQQLIDGDPKLKEVLPPEYWGVVQKIKNNTNAYLDDMHCRQIEENMPLWGKHGPMALTCNGLGFGKAVVGIGAGPSLKRNIDVLKRLHDFNALRPLDSQPFVLVASNHMLKPLVKEGIYPHFVALADGGEAAYEHLCVGVPEVGYKSVLLAALHCSPKILNEWDRRGGSIAFHLGAGEKPLGAFKKASGEDGTPYGCSEGGNVLNTLWLWSLRHFKSRVFMVLGNDLSYPVEPKVSKRRDSYYFDGEYKANIENKRDEATSKLGWMGFEYEFNPILNKWVINLVPRMTAYSLWMYKTWMEMQAVMHEKESWHYYNCSESGIAGVVNRASEGMDKKSWALMDTICPKHWHTRRLEDGVTQFLKAREAWLRSRETVVMTDDAGLAGQLLPGRIISAASAAPVSA